ncbi:hypothetical protein QBC39DRAFT_431674 [Podospora conica]|nr:hypothetical protein QBC39DRAFT_431674 [Schizothecium conicum]
MEAAPSNSSKETRESTNNMSTESFELFSWLPMELRLIVWEFAAATQARGRLLVVHQGKDGMGPGFVNITLVGYTGRNRMFDTELPCGVGHPANAEARAMYLARFRKVDITGDMIRTRVPQFGVHRANMVDFDHDMVYLALVPDRPSFSWAMESLGHVKWAPRVRSLAILVASSLWNSWESAFTDDRIRAMLQGLSGLQRFWLVVSMGGWWPHGFDNNRVRLDHGFLPVDLDHLAAEWPYFIGHYERKIVPLIDRIMAIAAEEELPDDLEVRCVFDVNHDRQHWASQGYVYRRHENTV